MKTVPTLIIGASGAGLACAAQLNKRQLPYLIIEKEKHVGHAWRCHYDRLHLHTNKSYSHLPFLKFPGSVPKYPSKNQMVQYLENYAKEMEIHPLFNTTVSRTEKVGDLWVTETTSGQIKSKNIIVCTGNAHTPNLISKPGIESFPGTVLHSSAYKNGKPFKNQKVLVIGFGNSACEVAICLHEHGAFPALSVRSAVNVIPRDILGIPVLQLGILQSNWPPRIADRVNRPLINFLIGDIKKYGLKKLPYGPTEQIKKYQSIPLLDIGTIDLIKKGEIKIFGDIQKIEGKKVFFTNDKLGEFDAIIMATGYRTGLEKIINVDPYRFSEIKQSIKKRTTFGKDNLFFCGFYVSPIGMFREINLESSYIADCIEANN